MPKSETARVEPPKAEATKADAPKLEGFAVQVGAFADKANAERLRDDLAVRFGDVTLSTLSASGRVYYRVRVGAKSRDEAEAIARRLAGAGYPALIVEAP